MNQIASASQLRASFFRWALFCVPGVVLLGFLSGRLAMSGPGNPWFDSLVKPAIYPPRAARRGATLRWACSRCSLP